MPAMPGSLMMLAVAAVLSLGGCAFESRTPSSSSSNGPAAGSKAEIGGLTYRAIDRLVAAAPELLVGKSVVVSSIVDEQQVGKSSPFGNLVADLARSRLVQRGIAVSETRLRSAVLFDEKQGSLMLANQSSAVVPPPSAAAVLTGTYAAGDTVIYVSLKLVGIADAHIVGAVDFVIPRLGSELLLNPPAT
jgi:hypothetical protein